MLRQQTVNHVEDKIKQLEMVESQLISQLGQTQNTQARALENLNSAIRLCNESIKVDKSRVSLG